MGIGEQLHIAQSASNSDLRFRPLISNLLRLIIFSILISHLDFSSSFSRPPPSQKGASPSEHAWGSLVIMTFLDIIEELPALSHQERRELCRRVLELESESEDVALCHHLAREGFAF